MRASYPTDPDSRQAMLDAQLHLLDRQVLDVHGVPVTTVDDLELTDPSTVRAASRRRVRAGGHHLLPAGAGHAHLRRPAAVLPADPDPWGRLRGRIVIRAGGSLRGENLDAPWAERWVARPDHRPDPGRPP